MDNTSKAPTMAGGAGEGMPDNRQTLPMAKASNTPRVVFMGFPLARQNAKQPQPNGPQKGARGTWLWA